MGYAIWKSDCHECDKIKQEHTKEAKRWRKSDRNDIWEKRRINCFLDSCMINY